MSEPIDPLDQLLREQNAYVDDNGFTARVVKGLPAHRRSRSWLRPAIIVGVMAVASVFAVRWLPWNDLPSLNSLMSSSTGQRAWEPWVSVVVVVGCLIWGIFRLIPRED